MITCPLPAPCRCWFLHRHILILARRAERHCLRNIRPAIINPEPSSTAALPRPDVKAGNRNYRCSCCEKIPVCRFLRSTVPGQRLHGQSCAGASARTYNGNSTKGFLKPLNTGTHLKFKTMKTYKKTIMIILAVLIIPFTSFTLVNGFTGSHEKTNRNADSGVVCPYYSATQNSSNAVMQGGSGSMMASHGYMMGKTMAAYHHSMHSSGMPYICNQGNSGYMHSFPKSSGMMNNNARSNGNQR